MNFHDHILKGWIPVGITILQGQMEDLDELEPVLMTQMIIWNCTLTIQVGKKEYI